MKKAWVQKVLDPMSLQKSAMRLSWVSLQGLSLTLPPDKSAHSKSIFLLNFSIKAYVVGTQHNRLDESLGPEGATQWACREVWSDWMNLARPSDKSMFNKSKLIFIFQLKHMLWVLKRTVSMRRFFWVPTTHVLTDVKGNNHLFNTQKVYLTRPMLTKFGFVTYLLALFVQTYCPIKTNCAKKVFVFFLGSLVLDCGIKETSY